MYIRDQQWLHMHAGYQWWPHMYAGINGGPTYMLAVHICRGSRVVAHVQGSRICMLGINGGHVCQGSTVAAHIYVRINSGRAWMSAINDGCIWGSTVATNVWWGLTMAAHVSSSMVVANINYIFSTIVWKQEFRDRHFIGRYLCWVRSTNYLIKVKRKIICSESIQCFV